MKVRRRVVAGSAAVVAAVAAAVLGFGRGGGTDDSGEPRFLRFVGNSLTETLRPFIRVEADGSPVRVEDVSIRRLSRTQAVLCVVARAARAGSRYSVQIVHSPAKRFGNSFPSAVVVRDASGDLLAETPEARASLCTT